MREPRPLRRARFDDLGLRRALSDRMLPFMVAAMAFLAALALAGSLAAASLARHWQEGAAAALTVQVPRPKAPAETHDGTRQDRVLLLIQGTPGIAEARALNDDELAELLRPWLGSGVERLSLPLPAVIDVRLTASGPDLAALTARLAAVAPGTQVESHGIWLRRLSALARSLQACAALALLVVAAVAASVVAVATRAGLAAQMLDKAREYRFISSVGEAKVPGYENLHKEPTLPNRVRAQSIPRFDSEIQSGARKLYPRSRRRGTSNCTVLQVRFAAAATASSAEKSWRRTTPFLRFSMAFT